MTSNGTKEVTLFKNIGKKESVNLREFLRKKKVTIKMKRGDGPQMVNSSIIDEQLGQLHHPRLCDTDHRDRVYEVLMLFCDWACQ